MRLQLLQNFHFRMAKARRDLFPFPAIGLPSPSLHRSPSLYASAYPPSLCCLLKPFCVIIFCGFAFSILPRRLPFVPTRTHTHTYTQGQKLLLMTLTGWAGTPPYGRSVRARALQLSFMQSQPHTLTHTVKHTHTHTQVGSNNGGAPSVPLPCPLPPAPACYCPRTWLAIRPQIASWACHLVARPPPPPPHTAVTILLSTPPSPLLWLSA